MKALELLKEKFPEAILGEESSAGQVSVYVKRERLLPVMRFLHAELQFDHLADLCGVDYLGWKGKNKKAERFEVVYNLYSIPQRAFLRVKVSVPEEDPWVPSVTSIWEVANWFEREVYDMLGVRFEGHPDLRRLLMPEDWEGHPLRKDYPLEIEEEWPAYQDLKQKACELSRFEWGERRLRGE